MSAELARPRRSGNPLAEPAPFLNFQLAAAAALPGASKSVSFEGTTVASRLKAAVLRWLEEEL